MQSAFIEIGLERAAFLHIADVIEQRQNPDVPQRIEKLLHEGATDFGASHQRSIGQQGRTLIHSNQHRRALSGLSAPR